MSYFTIAGVQMHALHHGDNTEAMRHRIDALMNRFPQVQMVLFSELMPMGASPLHAQALPSDTEAFFCQLAAQHRIWLIPGSMFEQVGEHTYNTLVVINPLGQVVT
ncbi:MAG: nitrilase-related carbon-nitrogen hydrolase, partial [Halomonas venusta]|nr:nitrilase-related carbon-nitrogen hydrolase [Halomonas venusta]